MRYEKNKLHYSFIWETYSTCAIEALGAAFKLDRDGILQVLKLVGWDEDADNDGMDTQQIRKALKILCPIMKKTFKYTRAPRRKGYDIVKFIKEHRKGLFLMNMDNHCCVVRNGVAIDDWNPASFDIEGWWQIIDKYPKWSHSSNSLSMAA